MIVVKWLSSNKIPSGANTWILVWDLNTSEPRTVKVLGNGYISDSGIKYRWAECNWIGGWIPIEPFNGKVIDWSVEDILNREG